MKARVKATGEIVFIETNIGYPGGYIASNGKNYQDDDFELIVENSPDYWEKLKHQYAGMAMQGILANPETVVLYDEDVAAMAIRIANITISKLKEESQCEK